MTLKPPPAKKAAAPQQSMLDKNREVEAQQYVGVYDLKAIRYGNYSDPQLYPNDRVVVSEAEARRLLQTIGPLVSLVTTPLIYLINRNR